MPAGIRVFIAGLVVAAIVFTGALYVGYRNGLTLGRAADTTDSQNVASLNIADILGPNGGDEQLVALAFHYVERVYYKPVDAQTLVDGERSGLQSYLKSQLRKNVALPSVHASGDSGEDLRAMDSELALAQDKYAHSLGTNGRTSLTQAAISGMLDSLKDPYTVYLAPDQIRALNEQLNGGNFGGIGVFIYQLKNGGIVVQPIDGLPAARAGMKTDEIVDRIDGSSVSGMPLDKVERLIRGAQGTRVSIVTHDYAKSGAQHRYSIVREIIHVPTVHQKMENGYNYIRLSDFGETSADEVRKALLAGKAHGAKGTILDLRDNGGGLLDAAVSISSYWVPKGVIVTEIDREGHKDEQSANGGTISGVTPLVILVNSFTASASEITAGALQDYKIATLIGTKTFGKGVVQGIYSMPNGGALKITTQRYLTPAGRDIQHKGIQPNIVVNQSPRVDLIDTPGDKQLQAAKAFLNRVTR
ncbi:MAG TPA: S41 family peptidase [Candidatus Baltobacteraceae bacterium]|nr:S41 family peptidase [Candidatus Baltobacteraceae bacterium]